MLQNIFGQAICFAVGEIFGNIDYSNNQEVSGKTRKVVVLIKVILMFLFVSTGVITTATVITTVHDKAHEEKVDLISTIENDLTASLSTTVKTTSLTEVNFTRTSSPVFSSSTTETTGTISTTILTTTTTTWTTTTTPEISCEFHEYFF